MARFSTLCSLVLVVFAATILKAQSLSEQVRVDPPMQLVTAPPDNATAEELETKGDALRSEKSYLDALDYYQAALDRKPNQAKVYNKMGITEMHLERLKDAIRDYKRAIRADRTFSDAYNNMGVIYYLQKNYGKAIREYENAVKVRPDFATYHSNMGAAYFAKKETDKAMVAYIKAIQLDPEVLSRNSRTGVVGQTNTPPEQRAYYEYMVAKAYAKLGLLDQALEHLRRSLEEQYKGIDQVYKDAEFATLRKDHRFTDLMAVRPPALPE